jgi:hypothetical protein
MMPGLNRKTLTTQARRVSPLLPEGLEGQLCPGDQET